MITLSLNQLAEILDITYHGEPGMITGVATDSREVKPGNLFVTWQGENFDGHQFCAQAVQNGARALLVTRQLDLPVPQFVVTDSIQAFGKIASFWRQQFNLPIVGVTGSNGKTTVKNMLASIFRVAAGNDCLAPIKSFNNHVGVPLTLCALAPHHQYAVIEMGMNHFGELHYLTNLVHPNVTVISNAGPCHLEGVGGTLAGVAQAKAEILTGLSTNGIAVLNKDDAFYEYWTKQAAPHPIISFGIEQQADVMATAIMPSLTGNQFTLHTLQGETNISLPLLGHHNVMNALAASAAALAVGLSLEQIKQGLEQVQPEAHRLQFMQARGGAGLLDDCYNANPNSVRKAIDVLKTFPYKQILVLGDMRELGDNAEQMHADIGAYAKAAGVEHLFAVGELMQHGVQAFGNGGKHFSDKTALITHLDHYLTTDHIILVKGSFSMNMLQVVEALLAE